MVIGPDPISPDDPNNSIPVVHWPPLTDGAHTQTQINPRTIIDMALGIVFVAGAAAILWVLDIL